MSFRVSLTKSGIGYSFGGKHLRYTKRANSSSKGLLYWMFALSFGFAWYIIKYTFVGMYYVLVKLPYRALKKLHNRKREV